MKTRIMLMSIIFMLLALPAEARDVYSAVLSRDVLTGAPDLQSVQNIVDVHNKTFYDLFQAGDLALPVNKILIIMGQRTAIKEHLQNYHRSNVTTTDAHGLNAYGCYFKNNSLLGKNITYVEIRSVLWGSWTVCPSPLNIRQPNAQQVNLDAVADQVHRLGRQ